ncbi:protein of unknown function [Catalinimonas alkaloidigena]|uniref:DUF4154 domain-containing protein n=1 Tax=Catalinimonas alkaloidigena TaxID=1075417 RepID=A0A1G9KWL3_9BACT|nr:YfiR family protein [Catalinimonas alkaloidigena]SDL53893.1 protein of unknown function [Catalinimonas alkaloidigena]
MTKLYRALFLAMLIALFGQTRYAQAQEINSKITTVFVFSFAKYIQWPPQASNGNFVIGVLGKTDVTPELHLLAASRKLGARQIEIREIGDASQLEAIRACHLLFVAERETRSLKAIAAQLEHDPVLLVSNGWGSLKQTGSMIHIFLDEESDRVRFELNRELMAQVHLKPSAQLISLADVK